MEPLGFESSQGVQIFRPAVQPRRSTDFTTDQVETGIYINLLGSPLIRVAECQIFYTKLKSKSLPQSCINSNWFCFATKIIISLYVTLKDFTHIYLPYLWHVVAFVPGITSSKMRKLKSWQAYQLRSSKANKLTSWPIYKLQTNRWHDDLILDPWSWFYDPWSLIMILCLLSNIYRLKCLKFETTTHSLTHKGKV